MGGAFELGSLLFLWRFFYSFIVLCQIMFVKVSPEVQPAGSMSWTSYYVRFLIKICYFPIYMEGRRESNF